MLLAYQEIINALATGAIHIQPAPKDHDIHACNVDIGIEHPLQIKPFAPTVCAYTREYIELPNWLAGRIETRSRYARQGLTIHNTSSLIHPGFRGQVMLEINNFGPEPIILNAGELICSLIFEKLSQPTVLPYIGRYLHQGDHVVR